MAPSAPSSCPHELRPGVTLCIHCRNAARAAARAKHRRFLGGAGIAAVVLGGVVALWSSMNPQSAADVPRLAMAATHPADSSAAPAARSGGVTVPASAADVPALAPRIPEGRTALGDGVEAVREGDTVAVHFDTPLTRTRRRDKFEHIVRSTLPRVYGPVVDSALGRMPAGSLTSGGDLLTELPVRGVRVPLADGSALTLWPATRPGQDGPLVVTYLATVGH
ncbi:MAG TPA: hypothetical protein VFS05_05600 [Gemmatimonadaceae bacterium]|nr:hypothetical protein [Gemmatimonadaceae bacterium]